jgi:copper oxidase (laccase) domain-containing protein
MEKVFAVITVARQVHGEYVFVRTEKCFRQAQNADALLAQKKSEFVTADGKPRLVHLTTPHGQADCMCEVGVFELEIGD